MPTSGTGMALPLSVSIPRNVLPDRRGIGCCGHTDDRERDRRARRADRSWADRPFGTRGHRARRGTRSIRQRDHCLASIAFSPRQTRGSCASERGSTRRRRRSRAVGTTPSLALIRLLTQLYCLLTPVVDDANMGEAFRPCERRNGWPLVRVHLKCSVVHFSG